MPDPTADSTDQYAQLSQVLVDRVRYGLTRRVSRNVADQLMISVRDHHDAYYANRFADTISVDIETELLTEHLPPETMKHRIRYTHPEAVGRPGVTADARFARPIDHFTATYRGRWWGRLIGLHRRRIRYQFVPVPYLISAPVECDHEVTHTIRGAWTYPRATLVLPGEDFGHPVLRANRVDTRSEAVWPDEFSDMVKRSGL